MASDNMPVENPMAAPPDQAAQMPAPEQQGMPAGGPEQATPEEQEMYNRFVANAMNLVYDAKTLPKIVESLKGKGDPVEGLAQTAAMVIGRVAESAEQNGQKIEGIVLLNAGTEVLEDLADLSMEAGIKDFTKDPDALEGAYFRGLDIYRNMLQSSGKIDQQAAQQDLAKLQEMDKNGELEQTMMRMAESDPRKAKKEAPAEDPAMSGGLMMGGQ